MLSRCWPWWTCGTSCRTASPVRWTMRPSSYLAGASSNVAKDNSWLDFPHFSLLSFYIPMVIMVTTYALTIHHLRFIFVSFQQLGLFHVFTVAIGHSYMCTKLFASIYKLFLVTLAQLYQPSTHKNVNFIFANCPEKSNLVLSVKL